MESDNLAYFAGYFDADGSICICSENPMSRNHGILHVAVGTCDKVVAEEFKAAFDGSITFCRNSNPKYRDSYQWRVLSALAASFLSQILPYLRLKQERARLALEFQARMNSREAFGDAEFGIRDNMRLLMHSMNAKGKERGKHRTPLQLVIRWPKEVVNG